MKGRAPCSVSLSLSFALFVFVVILVAPLCVSFVLVLVVVVVFSALPGVPPSLPSSIQAPLLVWSAAVRALLL